MNLRRREIRKEIVHNYTHTHTHTHTHTYAQLLTVLRAVTATGYFVHEALHLTSLLLI
jgi:hypothetical protein